MPKDINDRAGVNGVRGGVSQGKMGFASLQPDDTSEHIGIHLSRTNANDPFQKPSGTGWMNTVKHGHWRLTSPRNSMITGEMVPLAPNSPTSSPTSYRSGWAHLSSLFAPRTYMRARFSLLSRMKIPSFAYYLSAERMRGIPKEQY